MICFAASAALRIDRRLRAGFQRGFTLDRIDVDNNGALAAHRPVQRQAHQPKPAGADDDHRLLLQ